MGLAARMAEDISFVDGYEFCGFVGWVYGVFPLSWDFALGDIRTCFEGVLGLRIRDRV